MVSFLRVGDRRINERDLVHEPDMVLVLVLDPLLGRTVPVTEGLKEGGMVLINHPRRQRPASAADSEWPRLTPRA